MLYVRKTVLHTVIYTISVCLLEFEFSPYQNVLISQLSYQRTRIFYSKNKIIMYWVRLHRKMMWLINMEINMSL